MAKALSFRPYNGKEYDLDEEAQVVKLRPEFHNKLLNGNYISGFRKIGGSAIGYVLETDDMKDQFQAFCHIAQLKMPVLVTKYVDAGKAMEPKIFELLQKKFPKLGIQHIESSKCQNYDYFNNIEIVGGVPDGIVPKMKLVLEMKAVNEKKQAIWAQNDYTNVPKDYQKQAQLYAYLLSYEDYWIYATFLKDEDYSDPESVDITKRNIQVYKFKVNKEQAKDDIEKVKVFWRKYTQLGISPKYRVGYDDDLVDYLRCRNAEEWHKLFDKWKKVGKVDANIQFN